mmetsp:Transcript_5918/g.8368  ORF Transcript_5918/g.8368 Transcript_5918/m.8368 type:complete len:360 (+) Transcript_5918:98-1177(+)
MMAPIRKIRVNGEGIGYFSPEIDTSTVQNTGAVVDVTNQPDFTSSLSMNTQQHPGQGNIAHELNSQFQPMPGFAFQDGAASQNQIGKSPMMAHPNPGFAPLSSWEFLPQESFRQSLPSVDFNPYYPGGDMMMYRWMHPMSARRDQQGSIPAPSRFNLQSRVLQNDKSHDLKQIDIDDDSEGQENESVGKAKMKGRKGVGSYRGTYTKAPISFADAWEDMVDRLKGYKEKYGDCMVPWNFKGDPKLGSWVSKQRHYKSHGSLSTDRIKILEDLGFVWDATKFAWEEMFQRLEEYKKEKGDCLVPTHYKKDPKLGRWVYVQRHKKSKKMTKDQAKRLDAIGFKWSVHRAFWEDEGSSEGDK